MRVIFIVILSTFQMQSFAQSHSSNWLLGYDSIYMVTTGRALLEFNSSGPSIFWKQRPLNFGRSNAIISSSSGQLLFYTNGAYIANALDDTMLNGSGLNPSWYTSSYTYHGLNLPEGDIILPFPADNNKYYLFHLTLDSTGYRPLNLYYTIIDMTLDNGLGAVVSKNNILFSDSLTMNLFACRHANGREWWLMAHKHNSDAYYKFLITPNGILGPYTQHIGRWMYLYGPGQNCFSPDGEKFASYDSELDLDLMDFDRCTGDFSNLIHVAINDSASPAGCAFSPNSKVLYLSSMKYVYQFDLTALNIPASQTTVATWDGFSSPCSFCATTFFSCHLADDNRIYIISSNSTDFLHVINYPDSVGMGCDVCQHCLHIPCLNASIPNYPKYDLYQIPGSLCDSVGTTTNDFYSTPDMEIFPNPAREKLYITTGNAMHGSSVRILNTIGQTVIVPSQVINNGEYLEMNTSALSPGVYYIEIVTNKLKVVKRVIRE